MTPWNKIYLTLLVLITTIWGCNNAEIFLNGRIEKDENNRLFGAHKRLYGKNKEYPVKKIREIVNGELGKAVYNFAMGSLEIDDNVIVKKDMNGKVIAADFKEYIKTSVIPKKIHRISKKQELYSKIKRLRKLRDKCIDTLNNMFDTMNYRDGEELEERCQEIDEYDKEINTYDKEIKTEYKIEKGITSCFSDWNRTGSHDRRQGHMNLAAAAITFVNIQDGTFESYPISHDSMQDDRIGEESGYHSEIKIIETVRRELRQENDSDSWLMRKIKNSDQTILSIHTYLSRCVEGSGSNRNISCVQRSKDLQEEINREIRNTNEKFKVVTTYHFLFSEKTNEQIQPLLEQEKFMYSAYTNKHALMNYIFPSRPVANNNVFKETIDSINRFPLGTGQPHKRTHFFA